jgi:N-acetylneuraminic acid mutarotase
MKLRFVRAGGILLGTVLQGLTVLSIPASAASDRLLTFEERVAAQEAIERVYYSHQIGATKTFEQAVPPEVLEGKVRTYLQESVALEALWKTPVTAQALRAELARIAARTRFRDRLREIYGALGEDPVLILECFARPALVDRLARGFFAYDRVLHAAAREAAGSLRERLAAGSLDPAAPEPHRTVVAIHRGTLEGTAREEVPGARPVAGGSGTGPLFLHPDAYGRARAAAPEGIGQIGSVEEEWDRFTLRVVLTEGADDATIALYSVPKLPWDAWWPEARKRLAWEVLPTVADGSLAPNALRGDVAVSSAGSGSTESAGTSPALAATACIPDDTWDNGSFAEVPEGSNGSVGVWTGTHMIVWGGYDPFDLVDTGARYDPVTDTWSRLATLGAPSPRALAAAVWTGERMLVWGGRLRGAGPGGAYDPATDTWTSIPVAGEPSPRSSANAVWTGRLMLIWGGSDGSNAPIGTGARFDPETQAWSPITLTGAPTPRDGSTAVWTGSRMIVWGGRDSNGSLNSGGRYDPKHDRWSPTSVAYPGFARERHSAVWTGSRMIVWGGRDSAGAHNTGGSYDPKFDAWTGIPPATGSPPGRAGHSAVWTGAEMIVWGGEGNFPYGFLDDGGRYDPVTGIWAALSTQNAPAARVEHVAFWTGSQMLVWGGTGRATGGRYSPATDSWTPTSTGGSPFARGYHAAVWTGSRMIVWGGTNEDGSLPISGARYDPLTDIWSPTATVNAPPSRYYLTGVWTGHEAIFWGGRAGWLPFLNSGGRYDPLTDSWAATSAVGAPTPRWLHTAVWTGNRMLVWGGHRGDETTGTGGRYDPATDTWEPTSIVAAPTSRYGHSAVWTGSRMVVWGGVFLSPSVSATLRTGGVYDPVTDSWTSTSLDGAPDMTTHHTAVWTGSRMVVWGGLFPGIGARYDPAADVWEPMASTGAPTANRWEHTAVWTGHALVVWGGHGRDAWEPVLAAGGRYDPAADAWEPVSTQDEPQARYGHTAVWTGRHMLIWGGFPSTGLGGRYALDQAADLDADGVSACGGDCDDRDPDLHPGAAEICDGRDDDCDGVLPAGEVDNDADGAPACGDCADADPSRFPGNLERCDGIDNDCDGAVDGEATTCGLGACRHQGVCTAGLDSCVPGNPVSETCDGIDDDCDGILPPEEADPDADGVSPCLGDCDEAHASVYPGAPEVNDYLDNQCPGEAGFGLLNEISGSLTFPAPGDTATLCWPAQGGATTYQVARSDQPVFDTACALFSTPEPCIEDLEAPAPGGLFLYLVRATAPVWGSWGASSSGAERTQICGTQ